LDAVASSARHSYLNTQQLDSAKRCFLRMLDLPYRRDSDRTSAPYGLARYYKERKDLGRAD